MDWGDAPAWGALLVSLGAAAISIRALRHSERAAAAAERSAAADEAALAQQRAEAAERRAAEAEAARPRPSLVVHHHDRELYHLVNEGTGPADGVRFVGELPTSVIDAPNGVTLKPGGVHPFYIAPDFGSPDVSAVQVSWDGLQEPLLLRVPPKH
ncbi:hypothetical protein ACF1AY_15910 [Streptomyces sp. NPDC014776]|uniref:hypothetical protein n=1 Tax=unclassified Streptomyces TaxID=2593676 RepID=UPI0036F9F518